MVTRRDSSCAPETATIISLGGASFAPPAYPPCERRVNSEIRQKQTYKNNEQIHCKTNATQSGLQS